MKHLFALAAAAAALLSGAVRAQSPAVTFGHITLQAGMTVIQAEVADTTVAREQGLMYRKSLALNSGMLFDYGRPAQEVCMWMKNTDIPLSVAFMDGKGTILNIEDMQPQTEDSHCSLKGKTVRYALEMELGWFAQRHIGPGFQITKGP